MLDHTLRSYKDKLLNPIVDHLLKDVHPTTLTVIGFGFGVAAGVFATQQLYMWGLLMWGMNRLFDGLDGTVARRYHKQSDLGGYLDILLDDTIYVWVVMGLAIGANTLPTSLAALFLVSTFRINSASWNYLASLLEKRAQGAKVRQELTSITMPPGLIEGTETIAFYVLFFLLPAWILPLFWLMGALVLVTVVQRYVWAVGQLR